MAFDWKLDENGDVDITNNIFTPIQTTEGLARQKVDITLNAYQGEWGYDIFFGVPYLANKNNPVQLLSKGTTKTQIDNAIKANVLGVSEVTNITSYISNFNQQTRALDIRFTGTTESGDIEFTPAVTVI